MEYYKKENARLKEELPTFTRIMAASVAPGFVACNNAKLKTFGQDNYDQKRDAYRVAVCSGIQADKIFQQGSPSSPILIPAEYHSRPKHSLSVPTYLDFLSSKTAIDIQQIWTQSLSRQAQLPITYSGKEAFKLFTSKVSYVY